MSFVTVYILAGTSTEVLDPQYKAISCMFEALLMLTEDTGDQWRILADSVGRYRGPAARRSTENMDEATTKWFHLTITFIPPEDSRARMAEKKIQKYTSGFSGRHCIIYTEEHKQSWANCLKGTTWSLCIHPLICLHTRSLLKQPRKASHLLSLATWSCCEYSFPF